MDQPSHRGLPIRSGNADQIQFSGGVFAPRFTQMSQRDRSIFGQDGDHPFSRLHGFFDHQSRSARRQDTGDVLMPIDILAPTSNEQPTGTNFSRVVGYPLDDRIIPLGNLDPWDRPEGVMTKPTRTPIIPQVVTKLDPP